MPEPKRNTDFPVNAAPAPGTRTIPGIEESQPWRTADMQRALERWTGDAEAGFDPYNHVGSQALKPRAA